MKTRLYNLMPSSTYLALGCVTLLNYLILRELCFSGTPLYLVGLGLPNLILPALFSFLLVPNAITRSSKPTLSPYFIRNEILTILGICVLSYLLNLIKPPRETELAFATVFILLSFFLSLWVVLDPSEFQKIRNWKRYCLLAGCLFIGVFARPFSQFLWGLVGRTYVVFACYFVGLFYDGPNICSWNYVQGIVGNGTYVVFGFDQVGLESFPLFLIFGLLLRDSYPSSLRLWQICLFVGLGLGIVLPIVTLVLGALLACEASRWLGPDSARHFATRVLSLHIEWIVYWAVFLSLANRARNSPVL